jgi:hypothetical protein
MPAQAGPMGATGLSTTPLAVAGTWPVEQVQYYYYGAPRRYYAPGYYRHGGHYYRRGWRGDGVAAGVAAGAVGALALGALASGAFSEPAYAPIAPPRRQWCMDRFRSYNPATGTYIDSKGRTRYCG